MFPMPRDYIAYAIVYLAALFSGAMWVIYKAWLKIYPPQPPITPNKLSRNYQRQLQQQQKDLSASQIVKTFNFTVKDEGENNDNN